MFSSALETVIFILGITDYRPKYTHTKLLETGMGLACSNKSGRDNDVGIREPRLKPLPTGLVVPRAADVEQLKLASTADR